MKLLSYAFIAPVWLAALYAVGALWVGTVDYFNDLFNISLADSSSLGFFLGSGVTLVIIGITAVILTIIVEAINN